MVKKVVVIAGGGHSRVVISILKKLKTFKVMGYVDEHDAGLLLGFKWLGNDRALPKLFKDHICRAAVIGVGCVRADSTREKIFKRIKAIGFEFPVVISPAAIINEDVAIDEGVVVLDRAVVNCGARIERGGIINTGAIIEHDAHIGEFTHIASGAVIGGAVRVGKRSFIGSGAAIIQCCKVTDDCTVGAGGVVIRDIIKKGVYVGNPVH